MRALSWESLSSKSLEDSGMGGGAGRGRGGRGGVRGGGQEGLGFGE